MGNVTAETCIFCRIRDGQLPATKLYEDRQAFVIRDINPKAPTHLLIIARQHIPAVSTLRSEGLILMADLTGLANEMARREGIAESGYRLVINNGPDSGMEVSHLHIHLLGGRPLGPVA
jgi:histidine triad (HIT) family protein